MRDRQRVFKRKGSDCYYCWVPKPGGGVKPVTTHCTDRRAAEARAAELERIAVDPAYAAAASTTTERIMNDFLAHLKRQGAKRSPETLAFYEKKFGVIARVLVDDGVGPKNAKRKYPLTQAIDHAVLNAYIDERQAEGVMNTSVLKELRALGAAWSLARKAKLVHCAWDEIVPQLDDDHADRERALTPLELVALATVLPAARMAVVAFAAATGCDYSAIWRASPEDVSADRSMVHIHGRKRKSRDRDVPLPLDDQRMLVDWALAHADGGIGGRLFGAWPNIRNDLAKACERLGIPRCSPNDLRRTYGNWLSQEGVEAALVGPAMGHKDSIMAERVYAKLRGKRLGRVIDARVSESRAANERLMGAKAVETGASASVAATTESAEADVITDSYAVPGDGIEPPTRGFSIRDDGFGTPANIADFANEWAPNGRTGAPSREAAHRPLAWVREAEANLLALLSGVAS